MTAKKLLEKTPVWAKLPDSNMTKQVLIEFAEEYAVEVLENAIKQITKSCNYYENEVHRKDYSGGFKKSILLISLQIEELKKPSSTDETK